MTKKISYDWSSFIKFIQAILHDLKDFSHIHSSLEDLSLFFERQHGKFSTFRFSIQRKEVRIEFSFIAFMSFKLFLLAFLMKEFSK